jgi:hypothetical protein
MAIRVLPKLIAPVASTAMAGFQYKATAVAISVALVWLLH